MPLFPLKTKELDMKFSYGFRSRLTLIAAAGILLLIGVKFPSEPLTLGLVIGVISFLVDLLLLKRSVGDGWSPWVIYIGLALLIFANILFDPGNAVHEKLTVMAGGGISWSACWILVLVILKEPKEEQRR
jgi:hypothetical protein